MNLLCQVWVQQVQVSRLVDHRTVEAWLQKQFIVIWQKQFIVIWQKQFIVIWQKQFIVIWLPTESFYHC